MSLRGLEAQYYKCGGKGKAKTYTSGKRAGRSGLSGVARTEETIKIFDKVKARYIATKGRANLTLLYVEMVENYYSDKLIVNGNVQYTPYPVSKRPTMRQLYYHINKNLDDRKNM